MLRSICSAMPPMMLPSVSCRLKPMIAVHDGAGCNDASQIDVMPGQQREGDNDIGESDNRIAQNRRRVEANQCKQHPKDEHAN